MPGLNKILDLFLGDSEDKKKKTTKPGPSPSGKSSKNVRKGAKTSKKADKGETPKSVVERLRSKGLSALVKSATSSKAGKKRRAAKKKKKK
jgi:hypothetical protein